MIIDHKLLSQQKLTLLKIIDQLPDTVQREHLEGLLNLIDAVQDASEGEE